MIRLLALSSVLFIAVQFAFDFPPLFEEGDVFTYLATDSPSMEVCAISETEVALHRNDIALRAAHVFSYANELIEPYRLEDPGRQS